MFSRLGTSTRPPTNTSPTNNVLLLLFTFSPRPGKRRYVTFCCYTTLVRGFYCFYRDNRFHFVSWCDWVSDITRRCICRVSAKAKTPLGLFLGSKSEKYTFYSYLDGSMIGYADVISLLLELTTFAGKSHVGNCAWSFSSFLNSVTRHVTFR